MLLEQLFTKPIDRPIEGVIKADMFKQALEKA